MAVSSPTRLPGLRALLACAALAACASALGAGDQSPLSAANARLPIDLQAASSDFDYKNNKLLFRRVTIRQGDMQVSADEASASGLNFENSQWQLKGGVVIVVPDGRLEASTADVSFKDNLIARAVVKGSPASFQQQLKDKGQLARGRGATIEYDVAASTVRLAGDGWLSDGQNEIRGNTLVYDIVKQRVTANPNEKDAGGVHITIVPKGPPPPAPAPAPAPAKDKAP